MGTYASEWAYRADEAPPQSPGLPDDTEIIQEEYTPHDTGESTGRKMPPPRRRPTHLPPQIEQLNYEDYMTGSSVDRREEA